MIIYDKSPKKAKKPVKKEAKIDANNVKYIGLIILAVIGIIFVIFFYIKKEERMGYKYLKVYKKEPLVVTRSDNNDSNYPIIVPYINIKGDNIKDINEGILNFSKHFENKNNSVFIYNAEVNGDILSLVMEGIDNSLKRPQAFFRTVNINLETEEVLSNDDVLKIFNISSSQVEQVIRSNFRRYYQEEIKRGILDRSTCDYDCFLKLRGVDNYLDNTEYYISNAQLIAYRPFLIFSSVKGESDYYRNTTFKFQISQIK